MEHNLDATAALTEFDLFADSYYKQHKANLAITGESPEYFSEYKIADLAKYVQQNRNPHREIFDFGSGIGNSVAFFRKYFPESNLYCGDVSKRSLEVSQARFPGRESYIRIGELLPVPDNSFDIVFSACVFHHIPHEEHHKWLQELKRVTRPDGLLFIYEHNPLNPLTVNAVNNCPIDVNAHLIRGRSMKQRTLDAGWRNPVIDYKLFFPSFLSFLRPFESSLAKCCLGAQWRLTAQK
ncbi:MAG: class I SAM-dependent methyltransferase [Proteobacteria bacterium]|nr:class I SAM-dependent methyltransferase [Pseudomonadota bacterium]